MESESESQSESQSQSESESESESERETVALLRPLHSKVSLRGLVRAWVTCPCLVCPMKSTIWRSRKCFSSF